MDMATLALNTSAGTNRGGRQFGIELDLGRIGPKVSDDVARQLRDAVLAHGFVVLRDQRFTDLELRAFGKQFGVTDDRVIKYSTVGPVEIKDATLWHHHSNCDGQLDDLIVYYTPAVPDSGGTIEFFDAVGWLGMLSPDDLDWVRRRKVRHEYTAVAHAGIPPIANPPWHPMTTRREIDGKVQEAFYLGAHAVEIEGVEDMEDTSSSTPFGRIRKLAEDPSLYYMHDARPHDVIVWDMRMLAHRSHPWTTGSLRVIHEVIIRNVV